MALTPHCSLLVLVYIIQQSLLGSIVECPHPELVPAQSGDQKFNPRRESVPPSSPKVSRYPRLSPIRSTREPALRNHPRHPRSGPSIHRRAPGSVADIHSTAQPPALVPPRHRPQLGSDVPPAKPSQLHGSEDAQYQARHHLFAMGLSVGNDTRGWIMCFVSGGGKSSPLLAASMPESLTDALFGQRAYSGRSSYASTCSSAGCRASRASASTRTGPSSPAHSASASASWSVPAVPPLLSRSRTQCPRSREPKD